MYYRTITHALFDQKPATYTSCRQLRNLNELINQSDVSKCETALGVPESPLRWLFYVCSGQCQ
jgi:hypothetical protein